MNSPSLPSLLIARILSYNVTCTRDVAGMYLLSKNVGKEVMEYLPYFLEYWIRCPGRRFGSHDENGSFVEQLHDISCQTQRRFMMAGVILDADSSKPLCRALPVISGRHHRIRMLENPRNLAEVKSFSVPCLQNTTDATLALLHNICQSIEQAKSVQQWQDLAMEAKHLNIFTQPDDFTALHLGKYDNLYFLAMVNFVLSLSESSEIIQKTVSCNGSTFYLLDHQVSNKQGWCFDCKKEHDPQPSCEGDGSFFQHVCCGGQSWVVDLGRENKDREERRVCCLLFLKTGKRQHEQLIADKLSNWATVRTISIQALWQQHCERQTLIEGVAIVDNFLSHHHQCLLQQQVTDLEKEPGRTKHIVDPFFNMYCPEGDDEEEANRTQPMEEPCKFSNVVPFARFPYHEDCLRRDHDNFWGHPFSNYFYMDLMLPSYVSVSPNGECSFDTCITHLGSSPGDPAYAGLYKSLSFLFQKALPYMESVFAYAYAMNRLLRPSLSDLNAVALPLRPVNTQFVSFRGQKLQVITHIKEYVAEKESTLYDTDLWYAEGVSYEDIVLTCVYVLDDNDESVQGGEIEFQRSLASDEQLFFHWGCKMGEMNRVPLGNVATSCNRLIVYPNCHATHIKPVVSTNDNSLVIGKRRVVKFHLINPFFRIISTLEMAPPKEDGNSSDDSSHRPYAFGRGDCYSFYRGTPSLRNRELEAPSRKLNSRETCWNDGVSWLNMCLTCCR